MISLQGHNMTARILVVDDAAHARDLLLFILNAEGYHVLTAGDGHEGVELARAERPDLIISDIHMPNTDGLAMIRRLRREATFSSTPILALTAFTDNYQAALAAGADHALQKPVQPRWLVMTVRKLLKGEIAKASQEGL